MARLPGDRPPAGAKRHEVFSRDVERGEPEFRAALADYLKKYYDITLEPAPLEELPPGVGPLEDYRDDPYRPMPEGKPERLPDLAPRSPPPPRRGLE